MIPGPGDAALLALTGIRVFRELPAGEELGGEIQIKGETFVVTRRELDRIKNLPTPEEIRDTVARFHELLRRPPEPPKPRGAAVAKFAEEVLGVELLPWQKQYIERLHDGPASNSGGKRGEPT